MSKSDNCILSTTVYKSIPLDFFFTFYNMQSVSSNAVAQALNSSVLISNVLIGTYTLTAGQTISPDITSSIPASPQGYARFTQVYGSDQNYLQTSIQFVGNKIYMTATNHYTGTLTYKIYSWVMYFKNYSYV